MEPPLIKSPDESLLQQLCFMATNIKRLLIGPRGGTFALGIGDASLEFPYGAVEKETSVHYAIILHGPFVFSAGYKLSSVIVYLNMGRITLMKPVQLVISHWCSRVEGDDKVALHFLRAPHTLEKGQQKYVFEEHDEGDFFFQSHRGILNISEPRCLHCVEAKIDTIASYSAITFSKSIPSEDTQLFRIQVMCDSREWNEVFNGCVYYFYDSSNLALFG